KDVDIVLLRRRKKRRRQLTKFIIFALVVGLGITAYVKIDDWFPKLEGIGSRFHSVKSNSTDSDENFPLSISGGIDYQVADLGGSLAILSDAYLYIYDSDGELYDERQHAYANAMLQTTDKRALIYESGGSQLRVDSIRKNIFTKKLDNTIVFARISEGGKIAVITNSDTYACKLTVFDDSGEEVYSRNCVERVLDISFNAEGTGCILSTSDASEGEIVSRIISVSFDSKEDNWTSDPINTLCLKTYYDSSGIFVIGSTRCAYYSDTGKPEMTYDYPSTLVDWDYCEEGAALLFEDETKRQSSFTTISSTSKTPNEKKFSNSGVKCIRFADRNVLVLSKDGINRYGFKGTEETNLTPENSYERFIVIDDYIFLMGYDRIDRIEYQS
ncbi:MAG: DUF5711 family protein, partial [Porcipelethomonas sp.]